MKNVEYIIPSATFVVGLLLGVLLFNVFSKDCKTRQELCSVDIKEISLLRAKLNQTEADCFKSVDEAVEKTKASETNACSIRLKRIEDACNELDCLQCKGKRK
jgi:hypothetical protein